MSDVTPGVIRFGDGLSRGFTLLHANLGTFMLIALCYFGVQIGLGIVQQIPYLGILAALAGALVITPALNAGMFRACFKQHDGGTAEVEQFFGEFELWLDLLLLVIVQGLLALAIILPALLLAGAGGIPMVIQAASNPNFSPETWQLVALVAGIVLVLPLVSFAGMAFAWTYPALVDRRQGFWDAIKTSWALMKANPLGTFGTIFVAGSIGGMGIILCCVGLIYTAPAACCIIAATYRTAMPPADQTTGNAS